eukprot:16434873-Heterocapsa_arctica.AAC.1
MGELCMDELSCITCTAQATTSFFKYTKKRCGELCNSAALERHEQRETTSTSSPSRTKSPYWRHS